MSTRSDRGGAKRALFLKTIAFGGTGFALGLRLVDSEPASAAVSTFAPNAYLSISSTGVVIVQVSKSEMGQGVMTGLPMALAEELDYPFELMHIRQSPSTPPFYDPAVRQQRTDASSSTPHLTEPMRRMGATARAMLVAAVAQAWDVPVESLETKGDGFVRHSSGRSASYAQVASLAASQPVPTDVALKSADRFHTIGQRRARVDIPAKVNGRATFGLDVRLPGMLYASVQKPPVFGGSIISCDPTDALTVHGVRKVMHITSGIAVLGATTWAAMEGRRRLRITYDDGPFAALSSQEITVEAAALADQPALVARNTGSADTVLGDRGFTQVSALYRGPYLAHQAMEPMNATAWVHDGRCELWAPTQHQTESQRIAAQLTGLPLERISLETTFLGGAFGRKSETDALADAVEASKLAGAPVMVVYTREDDIQHDFYRSANTGRLFAAVDGAGKIRAWKHRVVCSSAAKRGLPSAYKDGIDRIALNAALKIPYDVPNVRIEYAEHVLPIPVGFWRAPGANWNAFAVETFIDELAHAARVDPYAFRRLNISDKRALAVLDAAAQRAEWGRPLPYGVHRGIAIAQKGGDDSIAAEVVEASFEGGPIRVHRIVIAAYVGMVINPSIAESQLESAALFGLSAAINGKITIARGRVVERNFNDAPVLLMRHTPRIEIVILPSSDPPTGIGELATPPIAPALGNAYFAATGKPIRSLPLIDALKASA